MRVWGLSPGKIQRFRARRLRVKGSETSGLGLRVSGPHGFGAQGLTRHRRSRSILRYQELRPQPENCQFLSACTLLEILTFVSIIRPAATQIAHWKPEPQDRKTVRPRPPP